MAPNVTTQFHTGTALKDMFDEELYPSVLDTLPDVCAIAEDFCPSWDGVEKSGEGIGREYLIRHTFSAGMAGHMKWVDMYADTYMRRLTDSALNPLQQHTVLATQGVNRFPSSTKVAMPGTYLRTIKMAAAMGNIPLPLEILAADKLDAANMKYAARVMKGVARMISLTFVNSFLHQASGILGTVATVTANYDGATADYEGLVEITALTTGRWRNFIEGQAVDIFKSDGSVQRNKVSSVVWPLIVERVDPLGGVLYLVCPGGVLDSAVVATDIIIPHGTQIGSTAAARTGPFGLEDWIKASGRILDYGAGSPYGLDVSAHPAFRSIVKAHSGVLTETDLDKYLSLWEEAGWPALDSILTTAGVTNKFHEAPRATSTTYWAQRIDRTGQVQKMVMGRAKVAYNFEGRDFAWYTSGMIPTGVVYILKRSEGNIKHYAPPPVAEAQGDKPANFGNSIEFVGRAMGYNGMWTPTLDSGEKTLLVEAPFIFRGQLVPEQPQSIKLTACTESVATP